MQSAVKSDIALPYLLFTFFFERQIRIDIGNFYERDCGPFRFTRCNVNRSRSVIIGGRGSSVCKPLPRQIELSQWLVVLLTVNTETAVFHRCCVTSRTIVSVNSSDVGRVEQCMYYGSVNVAPLPWGPHRMKSLSRTTRSQKRASQASR